MKATIFISSVQKELAEERSAIKEYIHGDPLLRRFFEVFLFEELPASDKRADAVYLEEVDKCAIYLGLFGNQYGSEDNNGLSPTEREFDRATSKGKVRLIFVKGRDDRIRHPKMRALMRKAGSQLIRRRFVDIPDLTAALYASLVDELERKGALQTAPFDAAACPRATLADISAEKLKWFLDTARRERRYALAANTPAEKALAHLNLLDHDHGRRRPTHAAVLLFGREPQRFLPTSEVKCMHFHGAEVRKPIPSYQIHKGTTFELVDEAVDFVMSKLTRSVGTRERGPQAPVRYELPEEAVTEAIVNAVAHRDYTSNASVQVMLFIDRLEVWNPGELPPNLTPEQLRQEHASIPRNPLISEPLFLAHYIEKAGTGTLDMIDRCREANLPEPEFEQRGGQFVVTLWRDWLTDQVIAELALNDRQKQAIQYLKTHARITNKEYQDLAGVAERTALRDLADLLEKGVLAKVGEVGRGAHYILRRETRHKPAKPAMGSHRELTRHKPAKAARGAGVKEGDIKGTSKERGHKGDKRDIRRRHR